MISGEFKEAGRKVVLVRPETDENGLPVTQSLVKIYDDIYRLVSEGRVNSAYALGMGGVAEAILKMAMGNMIGFRFESVIPKNLIFEYNYGGFVLELKDDTEIGVTLGYTTADEVIDYKCDTLLLKELVKDYEDKLESVYPCNIPSGNREIPKFEYRASSYPAPAAKIARPKVLIPVFPEQTASMTPQEPWKEPEPRLRYSL